MHRPVSQFKVTVSLADRATAGYSGTLLYTHTHTKHGINPSILCPLPSESQILQLQRPEQHEILYGVN